MTKYDDYLKNKNLKPDSLLHTLSSLARFGLMLIGLIGLTMKLFQENGWLGQFLNYVSSSSMGLISFIAILAALYGLNRWITPPTPDKASNRGNLLMYVMMALGAYFIYRYLTVGSI
jgi:hypothetical protein